MIAPSGGFFYQLDETCVRVIPTHVDNLWKTVGKTPGGYVENPVDNRGKDPPMPLLGCMRRPVVNQLSTGPGSEELPKACSDQVSAS